MLFKPLGDVENFDSLKSQILFLVDKYADKENQLSCQTTPEGSGDWKESIGRVDSLIEKDESVYRTIQPELEGTELSELIKKYNGFRTRIMLMSPRSCYSVHKDSCPRIHIPIITNNQAWMVWPYNGLCLNLKPGTVYWTDTRKHHSFFNAHDELTRIHVVMNVEN